MDGWIAPQSKMKTNVEIENTDRSSKTAWKRAAADGAVGWWMKVKVKELRMKKIENKITFATTNPLFLPRHSCTSTLCSSLIMDMTQTANAVGCVSSLQAASQQLTMSSCNGA